MALIPKAKIQGSSTADVIQGWHVQIKNLESQCEICKASPTVQNIINMNRAAINASNHFDALAGAGYTASVIGPYMNDYFGITDWTVYETEYEALRTTDLPALIAEATKEYKGTQELVNGSVVWVELADTTAILAAIDAVLAHFA